MTAKRIGLIVPHIVTNVDRELITGIFQGLKQYGYSLAIITGISNYAVDEKTSVYANGAENIYSLIKKGDFSGFIFAADWLVDKGLKEKIYSMLVESKLPCLVLEEENPYFPYIHSEQKKSTREITEHLIREHNCRKLYFLAGFKGHSASEERLSGFRCALEENGIEFSENNVFYGDFWTEKPKELAGKIISGEMAMPDAVVCACDTMAISLIDTLKANGIRVPEDVKITGNDGKIEAVFCQPPLTTICGRNKLLGQQAAEFICKMMNSEFVELQEKITEQIIYRESCGCKSGQITADIVAELRRPFMFHSERYVAMTTDFIDKIVGGDTLEELMAKAAAHSYRLPNWKGLAVCLCDDWKYDFSDTSNYRKADFSENMKVALEIESTEGFCYICTSELTEKQIIPDSLCEENPKVWLITSLHCHGQIFGYIATGYEQPDDIFLDENYCTWCDTISKGLRETENRLYQEYVREQISSNFDHDLETGLYSIRGLNRKAVDFLKEQENPILMTIALNPDNTLKNEINPDSMFSVALKRTEHTGEIAAHISENEFAILLPNKAKIPKDRLMIDRLSEIENVLEHYNTGNVHIGIFKISASSADLSANSDISQLVEQNVDNARRHFKESVNDNTYRLIEIRRDMRRNPHKEWNISAVADMLYMSRGHLQRLYSELFGISFNEDIIGIRIDRAKELLLNSTLSVSQIAFECGYNNVSHFMRQFKVKSGITALHFRNNK